VLPMLSREVVKRQQTIPVLSELLHRFSGKRRLRAVVDGDVRVMRLR
jgi:hypothetical protein